jgi:multiple sugar transport system permease protein
VRILEPAADLNKLVDLPGDAVSERSWVSLQWNNYPDTWGKLPFGRSFVNTSLVTVCVTLGQVLTCSLAAFAFARLRFPGRDKLFFGYLATMMIPGAVTLIPVYILFIKIPELLNFVFHTTWFSQDLYFLGKYYVGRLVGGNSYFALIAPGLFSAYGTFMLRQFFMTIPRGLEDAARVDGCSRLGIWWRVIIPLSVPALVTLTIFTFLGSWNDFMWPLIVTHTKDMFPIPVGLAQMQSDYQRELTLLMAASVQVLVPVFILFFACQKRVTEGIVMSGFGKF